jgi:hypothetical protein
VFDRSLGEAALWMRDKLQMLQMSPRHPCGTVSRVSMWYKINEGAYPGMKLKFTVCEPFATLKRFGLPPIDTNLTDLIESFFVITAISLFITSALVCIRRLKSVARQR